MSVYGGSAGEAAKSENIATVLGRKLSPLYVGEMGNRFQVRIERTRYKHLMGPVSPRMYHKYGLGLETTINDGSFFSSVEGRTSR